MMQEHKCKCGFTFIIGKNKVYGPITTRALDPRMMGRDKFSQMYADCVQDWYRQRGEKVGLQPV